MADLRSKYEREADDSELSPENKRQCLDNLKQTIETLIKLEKDLKRTEASKSTIVVQVLIDGSGGRVVSKDDFRKSFDRLNEQRLNDQRRSSHTSQTLASNVEITAVDIEENFKLDDKMCVNTKPMMEYFIHFESEEQARLVLEMKSMQFYLASPTGLVTSAQFVKPTQPYEIRKTLRTIGNLLIRLDKIQDEFKKIGAVHRGPGKPTLSETFLDKSWFIRELERAKAIRAGGKSLDHNLYGPLRGCQPVDSSAVQAQITALYDEECDILIKLREFQLNGVDFNF